MIYEAYEYKIFIEDLLGDVVYAYESPAWRTGFTGRDLSRDGGSIRIEDAQQRLLVPGNEVADNG